VYLLTRLDRIKLGACILVLGPGVALGRDDSGTPLGVRFSRELSQADMLRGNPKLGDPDNLRHVAQLYSQAYRDRLVAGHAAQAFYAQYEGQTTPFHLDVAALPFKLCISTTPDDLLCEAFKKMGKKPSCKRYSWRGTQVELIPEPTEKSPLVFHLYGHYSDPGSLVLSEADLIDFLVQVMKREPPLPDGIRAALEASGTSFLFIGFGFQHWYVRVLLRALGVYQHREPSIALEEPVFFEDPTHMQTVGYFDDQMIEFKPYPWNEFASKLRKLYEAEEARQVSQAPEPPPDAPMAFISYASEDEVAVRRLSERLRRAGIRVWRDKDNLRVGDEWREMLKQVIQNKTLINYVIVAQSQTMCRRTEGVFFDEIAAALERQRDVRPDLRFLIPVKIEECDGLAHLRGRHQIDVSTDGGVLGLVEAISADWRLRGAAPK
jgi:hypothetical protein